MSSARLTEVGLSHLGPDINAATAELRAWQLSSFMRHEVHTPVYEQEFGLRFIDTDPPSGTPGDIPWRVESMRKNHTDMPDGSYREYIIAAEQTADGNISDDQFAIKGLLVVTKPQGRCEVGAHRPSHIAEIDVARDMYGTGLAVRMLGSLRETHPQDPYLDMETYEHNTRSMRFHGRLGFIVDYETPPRGGTVYAGKWIRMYTSGGNFSGRLAALLTR